MPAICRAISIATGNDSRTDDREQAARSTVESYRKGEPTTGYVRLCESWSGVAAVIDEACATGMKARMRALLSEPGREVSQTLEETTAQLKDEQ